MTKRKPPEGKQKAGRPSSYKPEFTGQVFNYCLLGATDEELADFFEVSVTTIDNWKKEHPEFLGAMKRGKAQADAEVAEKLFQRAKGYSHNAVKIFMPAGKDEPVYADYVEHYPPDTAAAFIWLKNRQSGKWRDKQEVEHTASDELINLLESRRKRSRGA